MTGKDRLETIREMRAIDPETGQPKHTQKEVAEELGVTRARISQIESEHNLKPHQISYVQDNQENKDEIQTGEGGDSIRKETGGREERESGESGERMSESESESESEDSDGFICTNCGNNTYHSANDYLNKFGERLNQEQINAVNNASKICASCGTTH